jgi:hypothetical protein
MRLERAINIGGVVERRRSECDGFGRQRECKGTGESFILE